MHLSTTVAVLDLPPKLMEILRPQLGLPLDWPPMKPTDSATTSSVPELVVPHEPRPTS